ncbi:MAG: ABC transporter ATP-binding protein [Gammaproteobacteria bacterium]|jgi:lipoprotein-releasing system ATP-binding protein
MNNIILECQQVSKIFFDGTNKVPILANINLQVTSGQQVAIMGRSGSGKTTLLQLLGGLDVPTNGIITLCNQDLNNIKEQDKAILRNNNIGFIYQLHHLLAEFTALENVCMPLLIQKMSPQIANDLAASLLEEVGLSSRLHFKPNKLSGGERQRVAIARALINNPNCILADEPTGNLDVESAEQVMDLISNLNKKRQAAVIMVTHDHSLAKRFDRIYQLQNGQLI